MIFKLLFAAGLIIECAFVPWFLKAMWPQKNKKSLRLKMICAGAFVLMSVSAIRITGEYTKFACLMLIAALFGFMGDYFLHAKGSALYFIFGLVSFLFGHITYIGAFVVKLAELEGYKFVNFIEILVFLLIFVSAIITGVKMKMKFKPSFLIGAVILYAAILIIMFIKACALGIELYKLDGGNIAALILLSAGSLCFVLSDATLGIILFGGQKGNYPLKIFNIVTYFVAQAALAASILFVA